MKKCFICSQTLELDKFYRHPKMPDGTTNKCKECTKEYIRKHYRENIPERRAYDIYRNRHSIARLFLHKYGNLVQRCTKVHPTNWIKKSVYWKEYLTKKEWNDWCHEEINYKKFMDIYNTWVQNWFCRKLAPSIDRIDNKKWYVLWNLQWLSQSNNSKKYTF